MKNIVLGVLPFLLISQVSLGAKATQKATVRKITPYERIPLTISLLDTNKITIENSAVARVYGDQGHFSFENDHETGQLFFKVVEPLTHPLTVTIVTTTGETQDIEVRAGEKKGAHLRLRAEKREKVGASLGSVSEGLNSDIYQQECMRLMKAILKEEALPDAVVKTDHLSLHNRQVDGLKMTCIKKIERPFDVALFYRVTNEQDEPISLKESIVATPMDELIYMKAHELEVDASTEAVVIQRKIDQEI